AEGAGEQESEETEDQLTTAPFACWLAGCRWLPLAVGCRLTASVSPSGEFIPHRAKRNGSPEPCTSCCLKDQGAHQAVREGGVGEF
ncbi:Hypothetical predicted protein, partial [Olea europaea subsp. europaea]